MPQMEDQRLKAARLHTEVTSSTQPAKSLASEVGTVEGTAKKAAETGGEQ